MPRQNRFTIYDAMEAKGVFDSNPANQFAKDSTGLPIYKGPVEYPKMLYHPKGEERVSKPAEAISTPFGPKMVGEERRLIFRTVENEEEEKELLKAGWHRHPKDAVRARAKAQGVELPAEPMTPQESEMEKMRKMIEDLQLQNNNLELALQEQNKKSGASGPTATTVKK